MFFHLGTFPQLPQLLEFLAYRAEGTGFGLLEPLFDLWDPLLPELLPALSDLLEKLPVFGGIPREQLLRRFLHIDKTGDGLDSLHLGTETFPGFGPDAQRFFGSPRSLEPGQ